MNTKNTFNLALFKILVILGVLSCSNLALSAPYKCVDENDNVTYSDERCLYQTGQKLDIVVPPVDKASAERLKYYKDYESHAPDVENNITTMEAGKANKKCDRYSLQIKRLRDRSRAGYDSAEGEGNRQLIRQTSKAYNDCMSK